MPPTPASDADLIAAVLGGKGEAFRPLMERYQQAIFNYLYRRVGGDTEAALDLTQGVFLKAYQHLADVDPAQGLSPWLYRIAHNEAANHARGRSRRKEQSWAPQDLERLPNPEGRSPAAHLEERQENRRIREALDTLPERQREVLTLHYFEDRAYEDIADILGIPVGTVGTLIHRGRARLRQALGEPEGADSG